MIGLGVMGSNLLLNMADHQFPVIGYDINPEKTKLFESYGVVKKDWVEIPDTLLKKTKELKKYLDMSFEHTKTLKPK